MQQRAGYNAPMAVTVDAAVALQRRGLRLEYATLGWNVTEVAFVGFAAYAARSVALAGFSIDSLIEIFASVVVVWQLRGEGGSERERRGERLIGVAFFLLAVYIIGQTALTLAIGSHPHQSLLGIGWLSATVVAMLALAFAKAQTGAALDNPVLQQEARVTLVDGLLASGVLAGLVLNATLGWWGADLAAGGIIVVYGLREGYRAFADRDA